MVFMTRRGEKIFTKCNHNGKLEMVPINFKISNSSEYN